MCMYVYTHRLPTSGTSINDFTATTAEGLDITCPIN